MHQVVRRGYLILVLAAPQSVLHGQNVSTTVYVGAGPETNGLSAAVGLRVEAGRTWGAYARAALREVTNVCETSLPPKCNYPKGETGEYAAGVSRIFAAGAWRAYVGVGGGVLSWQGESDTFVDLTADVRRTLGRRTSILFGIHAVRAPDVEREPRGDATIVSKRTVFFPNAILGLAFRIW